MPYGYGPPPPYPPHGAGATDETTWALLAYLGQLAAGFIAPLVVYLARKDQSPFVRFHGAQALNFALTYYIVFIGSIILGVATLGIGLILAVPVLLAFGIAHLVFLIIAAVRAGRHELYQIPRWLCWPMVR
jgi:hypothetical protein